MTEDMIAHLFNFVLGSALALVVGTVVALLVYRARRWGGRQ